MHFPDYHCPTCGRFSILGGDISESSHAKQTQRIAAHTALHTAQLEEHNGDHDALAARIKNPAAHAAVKRLSDGG